MTDDRILNLILSVANNASPHDIENAAKAAQRFWHPDKWKGLSPEQVTRINAIFDAVTNIRKNPSGLNHPQLQAQPQLYEILRLEAVLPYVAQMLGGIAVNMCLSYFLTKLLEINNLGKDENNFLFQVKQMLDSQSIKIISHNSALFSSEKESAFDFIINKVNNNLTA